MSETRRGTWGRILSGVPKSEPADDGDNVVHMPRPTLDQLENDCREAQNAVVAQGIEVDRAAMAYRTRLKALDDARQRLAERLKESGAKVEFTQQFPDIE
jgi:hypothetical protein